MNNLHLLFALCFVLLLNSVQAQRNFKYPKTAFGAELSAGNYTFVQESDAFGDYNTDGLNVVVRGLFEYNPRRWLGLSTGFGIDVRRYTESSSNEQFIHGIVGLQVPLLVQLRAGKVFSFDLGGDINFLVYNKREKQVIDGKPYPIDLVGYSGLRLRLYKGLSIGAGIRWGLTPLYEQYKQLGFGPMTKVTGTHRGVTFSLRYMFY